VREVIELVASSLFLYGIIYAVIRFDEKRLRPEQLARAWPESSRDAAVLGFSLIALFLHFPRTRGPLLGTLLGLLAVAVVVTAHALVFGTLAFFLDGEV